MKKFIAIQLVSLFVIIGFISCTRHEEKPIPEAGIQETAFNPETGEREVTYLSDIYEVDGIYKSMKGPSSVKEFSLNDSDEPELLWITGYKAEMVEPDGETPMSQEFMCHSNLDIDIKTHEFLFKSGRNSLQERVFTISQGQYEIDFPEGFGIPILSPEELSLTTQVLNLNLENPEVKTRHRVTISYIKDSDLKAPIKPLMQTGANGLKRLNEQDAGYFNVMNADGDIQGSGCLLGEQAGSHIYTDQNHQQFTGHWVVKPGTEVNNTLVTEFLKIPYDTTIHYIAVHLHPFAESLELKDLTTGQTLFKSKTRNSEDKIGLDHVDYFSSPKGIPIYKDHQYQMTSVYNNTTDTEQDSMATMYIYMLDKNYKPPDKSLAKILTIKRPAKNPDSSDM